MLNSLERTRETSSGGPHPAGEVPQSAASTQDDAAASEISSCSDGEHLTVQQILRDVRKLGRQPREFNNPVSEAQRAENIGSEGSQAPAEEASQRHAELAKMNQETSSGGPHLAGQVPQTAASTALPSQPLCTEPPDKGRCAA